MAILRNAFRGLVASLVLAVALATSALGQTASILPNAKTQFLNANGQPVAGGFVYTCVPNTSCGGPPPSLPVSPKTTWQDAFQTIPNADPVVLDSAGSAFIFGSGNYVETLYDSVGNLVWSGFTSTVGSVVTGPATSVVNDLACWNNTTGTALNDCGILLIPSGPQLFASPSGNDTNNTCTNSGTPCTLKGACAIRTSLATFSQSLFGTLTINLANGTYSSLDSNNALCTIFGNSGGSAPMLTPLVGNVSSPSSVVLAVPANAAGVTTKDLGETSLSGITITGGNNAVGASAAQFSVVDIMGVVWGTWGTGGIHLQATQDGSLNILGETLNANISTHINMGTAHLLVSAGAINIPAPIVFSGQFMASIGDADLSFNSSPFTGAGVSGTTGKQAFLVGPGFLTNGGIPCVSFFPGDGGCTIELGFMDDASDFPTVPVPGTQFFPVKMAGVNFNSATTDNAITIPTLPVGAWGYIVSSLRIGNASHTLTTATAGLFTATGGTGTIAADQAITVTNGTLGSANNTMTFTLTNGNTQAYSASTLYFRIGTAESAAATADVTITLQYLY